VSFLIIVYFLFIDLIWGFRYPIVDVTKDGVISVRQPPGTGGLVSVGTVTEQIVYEVLDPGSYLLPDVTLDLRQVAVVQKTASCVEVYSLLYTLCRVEIKAILGLFFRSLVPKAVHLHHT
jgi:hypothetical protein